MSHLIRFKYFYTTFLCWWLLGGIGARALIFSPFHLNNNEISKFETFINGFTETNQISVIRYPFNYTVESISESWTDQGWKRLGGSSNIAPFLFNIPPDLTQVFGSFVQIQIYEKNESIRMLSLLTDQTNLQIYQWTADISKQAFLPIPLDNLKLPLSPPQQAKNVFIFSTKRIKTFGWTMANKRYPLEEFRLDCSSQGYSCLSQTVNIDGSEMLLQKGPTRLIALIKNEGNYFSFLLMQSNLI